jgi:hypothetical protein
VPIAELLPEQTSRKAFQSQIKDLLARYRPTLGTDRRFLLEQDESADLARKSSAPAITGRVWTSARWPRPGGSPHASHLCSLPGHNTLDLGLQREAQNRPDQDDQPENQEVVEGGCDGDRTDEVGRHEVFQPEQQCPADSRAQRR